MKTASPPKHILPVIVTSQFLCTSLWFAGNGVMPELVGTFQLQPSALGHLTIAVQLGFICGTLLFAILSIADRISPSKVFFSCALLGSLFNIVIIVGSQSLESLFLLRFLTGFFLAGIYPVGMKIAADYFDKGLGKSLGFLVGALVLGTAFPHLLRGLTGAFPWKTVIVTTSIFAFLGGVAMVLLVPDGPFRRASQKFDFRAFFKVFKRREFRAAAFGYFGHMWELYAFWAFVPVILQVYMNIHPETHFNVSVWSFMIIGVGGIACVISGYLAQTFGTKQIAFLALMLSCFCCLASPVIFGVNNELLFLGFLIFWGLVVIADSPLFSTLAAQNAIVEYKGTALTIVNCIGFSITIVSIQLLNVMSSVMDLKSVLWLLALGPIIGLWALREKRS